MKSITLLPGAVVIVAGIIGLTPPVSVRADDAAAPAFVTKILPDTGTGG